MGISKGYYIDTFSATFLIWTPCTREAPPRMAVATWTASVISAVFDPVSRHERVYASMQYGHWTAWATARAISDFSR
jgi:hypothetical protein